MLVVFDEDNILIHSLVNIKDIIDEVHKPEGSTSPISPRRAVALSPRSAIINSPTIKRDPFPVSPNLANDRKSQVKRQQIMEQHKASQHPPCIGIIINDSLI